MESHPSEMFKVLGVDTRLKIIGLLKSKGPLGAKNIAGILCITPSAVSQHLKVLRQAGLVRNERKGYWIPYSIDEQALHNCCCVLNEVCTCECGGTGGMEDRDLNRGGLASLERYEKELERELQNVRERITELRSRNK